VQKLWVPIVLAWAAGFVDSLGFVALSHEFTSHMSGNAAATGAELGSGNFREALIIGSAIPGFVLGVCAGVAIDLLARRRNARGSFFPVLLLECGLLACFIAVAAADIYPVTKGSLRFFLLVECLSVAMGLQASVLRCARDVKVSTTFVTGMLTNTAEEFTRFLLLPKEDPAREQSGFHAALFGGIFLAFMVGGVGGAVGHHRMGAWALGAPLVVLLMLAMVLWVTERRVQSQGTSR
jgi:uncharacterized membrane protein YoaK (UPF0700 family)